MSDQDQDKANRKGDPSMPFAVYKGLEHGNRFISSYNNTKTEDENCRSAEGELWYEIVGWAKTIEEAQEICFGVYEDSLDFAANYLETKLKERAKDFGGEENIPDFLLQLDMMSASFLAGDKELGKIIKSGHKED
jgi:hypothetical protein